MDCETCSIAGIIRNDFGNLDPTIQCPLSGRMIDTLSLSRCSASDEQLRDLLKSVQKELQQRGIDKSQIDLMRGKENPDGR